MSDTCIVCLGDLGEGDAADVVPSLVTATIQAPKENTAIEAVEIAHLLPRGHNLHHECLKPWVERANSCPICRQNFNVVELTSKVGGPAVSSYVVEDRVQVADIDPSMLGDDLLEYTDEFQPCSICGDDDNEAVLLLCDGCDVASHTYCLGLDSVPSGPWFCMQCSLVSSPIVNNMPMRLTHRRTRADQRRYVASNQVNALHWARVWQSVWDQLHLDLDFPFDDEEDNGAGRTLLQRRQEETNLREFRAWERRIRVAERQGGSSRLREAVPALLEMRRGWPSRPRPRIQTPEPESIDEIRAWNAFERANAVQEGAACNRRKRKSPTASPVEPEPAQPERKLKRPRTKRPEALADILDHGGESSSRGGGRLPNGDDQSLNSHSPPSGPSFLQSLLREVEESSTPNLHAGPLRLATLPYNPTDMNSSGPSSPALSPLSSSRSSSRPSSTTPPPRSLDSVPSDFNFSSPEFSPSRSPAATRSSSSEENLRRSRRRIPGSRQPCHDLSPSPPQLRSNESSPTRGLSLSTKSHLQKMVSSALKPYYRRKEVSKEEYTDINRRISRLLYDQVDASGTLDSETKSKLAIIASEEVSKAVSILRDLRVNEASDSSGAGSALASS
ncbi:hypothetical protein MGYG_07757 [Nannizzia gypsea CBS 118893]|uniref:PHD and RING finger domain-containing protein n=1 Tax=Arthroderma gypseum (strain ATCC MYA-4604 / CBS 118893) TaxID=535722 RepID=E4V425_ARTGP|nr:hypothetical protein MGYG_07757 [Nannizzia gypsea CBS 118893]EFR04749.1 hypothetical protein MGYG_07757 [Nannizzia gypsea CBS 118893]